MAKLLLVSLAFAMGSPGGPPRAVVEEIVPGSMCLTLLVRDGLGIPTVRSHHQPAAVRIALPRRLERLAQIDLVKMGLPSGIFLEKAKLAPYSVASGALMPLKGTTAVGMTTPASPEFISQLSELLSRLYAQSMGSWAFLGQGLTVSPVINTFSGNLFVCSLDSAALWKGLNVMLYRIYNGLQRNPGPFGPGWTHSLATRLDAEPDGSIQYSRWDGSRFCYKLQPDGSYKSPDGFDDSLTISGTGHMIQDEGGLYLVFDSAGKLSEIGNRFGFRIKCEYKGEKLVSARNMGTIIKLTAAKEEAEFVEGGPGVFFAYNDQGMISEVRSTSGMVMKYSYGEAGRLAKVVSNADQAAEYRYDGDGRLVEVRGLVGLDVKGAVNAGLIYDESDRIKEVIDASGNTLMRLSYRWGIDRTTQVALGESQTLVTDKYDERGVLIERNETTQGLDASSASGARGTIQRRECDPNLNVTFLSRQDGTYTRWNYDRRNRLVRAADSDGSWVEMRYDPDLGLTDYISSSSGRWIRFIYEPNGEIREVQLDDGRRYKLVYDDGAVPRELVIGSGETKPLDLGLPPEIPGGLWEF